MEYIKDLLSSLDVLKPIETGVSPRYQKDESIKALVFDIYGTLLISSSGDIEQSEMNVQNLKQALDASNIKLVAECSNALQHILDDFEFTIKLCHHSAKQNNVPFPEIDILSIWQIVLIHARKKKLIDFDDNNVDTLRMTCVFEFLSNKIYPMPGLNETIAKLTQKKYPLGIISNAQFYTPVVMNYYLENKFELKETIEYFDKELTVFSYKLGVGKPDTKLFEEIVPTLKRKYNLEPNEVAFVGNDMLKDIYTSNKVGFKTILFAGDKRSLRMRENDDRVKNLEPDYIVTDLSQILEIIN